MAADETTSTASATATTTTNASGRWSFSALAENLYDVRITTGSTVRWRRQADEIQVEELETSVFKIRTPDNAFIYDIVPGAIAASRTLNLPVLLATDTLAVLGLAQTFSGAQTMGAGGVGLTVSADQRTNGIIYVGDNTNANMTAGLTLNQGAADNQILAMKSSDVATGLTSVGFAATETDDFATFQKRHATLGGLTIQAVAENDAGVAESLFLVGIGATAGALKTSAASGLVTIRAAQHDGANALANIAGTGNLLALQGYMGGAYVCRYLFGMDGYYLINGGTEPAANPADAAGIYCVDLSAGNASLGIVTETAVVTETVTSDRTLSVRINGVTYKICLKS